MDKEVNMDDEVIIKIILKYKELENLKLDRDNKLEVQFLNLCT